MGADIDATRAPSARYRAGSSDTRGAIVRASERWFRRVGFRRTAVSDVAAELGMSPANVYRFFISKAAINEAVAERVLGEIADELCQLVESGEWPPAERLRRFLLAWAETTAAVLGSDDHIGEMVDAAMSESWDACVAHTKQIDRLLGRIIEMGIATGAFVVGDIDDAARCARASMLCFTHPGLVSRHMSRPTSEQMVSFILGALGAMTGDNAAGGTGRQPVTEAGSG